MTDPTLSQEVQWLSIEPDVEYFLYLPPPYTFTPELVEHVEHYWRRTEFFDMLEQEREKRRAALHYVWLTAGGWTIRLPTYLYSAIGRGLWSFPPVPFTEPHDLLHALVPTHSYDDPRSVVETYTAWYRTLLLRGVQGIQADMANSARTRPETWPRVNEIRK